MAKRCKKAFEGAKCRKRNTQFALCLIYSLIDEHPQDYFICQPITHCNVGSLGGTSDFRLYTSINTSRRFSVESVDILATSHTYHILVPLSGR